ncbi:MAG: sulfotransferase [Candidatus Marinimicrobia bacterium]|nr:sulfotransferase [Candidatus Neomarinimicrobiota bacterium]
MPVCITGMHRTGTSLVARILNLCGLYLGPAGQLLPPGEGNPQGFWENDVMDRINEALLAHLADGWDFLLPDLPDNWHKSADLDGLREQASEQIAILSARADWGWKDPRTSLTLPFWMQLLPDLKVVICLRHPFEAAQSLAKRVGSSMPFGLNLWHRYYEQILRDTQPEQRIITHFDAYFLDAESEIRRVAAYCGLDIAGATLQAACQAVAPDTREQTIQDSAPAFHELPGIVARLYEQLCYDSGEVITEALETGRIKLPAGTQTTAPELEGSDRTMDAGNVEGARKLAEDYLRLGRNEDAIKVFLRLLEEQPNDVAALLWLADAARRTGAVNKSRLYLQAVLSLQPENADAAVLLDNLPE